MTLEDFNLRETIAIAQVKCKAVLEIADVSQRQEFIEINRADK